jgi:hypothetical protein
VRDTAKNAAETAAGAAGPAAAADPATPADLPAAPPAAPRTHWQSARSTRAGAVLLVVFLGFCLVDTGVTDFAWWRVVVYPLAFIPWLVMSARALSWQVTATPVGLCVRVKGAVRTLPWADLTGAAAKRGGGLVIVGSCRGKGAVIGYAGFRAPRRIAAEIAAMIRDPALRPAAG